MKNKQFDIWDWTILFGAVLIILWALLKALGIINSPVWVEMVPYFGGALSIVGGAYKLGKIKKGIEETESKVDKILKIEERFTRIESEHNLAMSGRMNIHS